MKILLVEDDIKIADFIIKGFKEMGYVVEHVTDGQAGLDFLLNETYNVAIVDIMLPKLDGFSLIDVVRQQKNMTPVLILSAKRSVDDRVKGLHTGGDDYLVKPFAFSELSARIHALTRRAQTIAEPTDLTVADLILNIVTRKVFRSGKEIVLQPKEFALLEYLMRNKGRVVTKTMIIENVWDYNFDPRTNVVESRVCYLRDKIDKLFTEKLIHTIRGVGYVLEKK